MENALKVLAADVILKFKYHKLQNSIGSKLSNPEVYEKAFKDWQDSKRILEFEVNSFVSSHPITLREKNKSPENVG